MTISSNSTYFPYNAIDLMVPRFQTIDSGLYVCKRPLRESDPNQSVGVFAQQWMPNEDAYEMRGMSPSIHEPTLSSYIIGIQAFVKDADEERGAAVHATLSKTIRTMLYRDNTLRVGLRSLSASVLGSLERTTRFGIRTQRYLSNELSGSWLYLSTIEFFLETETS
ncbi:MAG TPA: hypothetical protein VIY48_18005 [Candidatus Paceibacterota bacterium]